VASYRMSCRGRPTGGAPSSELLLIMKLGEILPG
jgi:hypothetical protein